MTDLALLAASLALLIVARPFASWLLSHFIKKGFVVEFDLKLGEQTLSASFNYDEWMHVVALFPEKRLLPGSQPEYQAAVKRQRLRVIKEDRK